jgi:hypothetical protein
MTPDGDTTARLRKQTGGLLYAPARRLAGSVGSVATSLPVKSFFPYCVIQLTMDFNVAL